MAPSKFWGTTTKKPSAREAGKLYKENSHHSADKQGKNSEFTLQRCKMLVNIGLVPLHFYQYGSDDSDKVGAQQDSTRRNVTETLTDTTRSVTQSLKAITMNMTQCVASTSSKTAKDNTTGNDTHSFTATASNVPQSLAATTNNLAVDDDDRKPAAVLFEAIATARNVTQLLEATAGNNTQSPAVAGSNVSQSLAATTNNVAVDDEDRKPADVLFEATGNKTHSLADTASNVAQSLAAITSDVSVDDDDRKPAAVLFEANSGNKTQSPTATARNVAQLLAATTSDVSQSTVEIASDVSQSLTVMASKFAQSSVAAAGNTKAKLACFSPEMISEDAAASELLLEQPPLSPQVIETLLSIFHPIICLQLLTILPFICIWLQMMQWQENLWNKIAKQTPLSKSSPRELQHVFFLTQMPIN
jgi:hypothetical protein